MTTVDDLLEMIVNVVSMGFDDSSLTMHDRQFYKQLLSLHFPGVLTTR
jgi:hypothetical protein